MQSLSKTKEDETFYTHYSLSRILGKYLPNTGFYFPRYLSVFTYETIPFSWDIYRSTHENVKCRLNFFQICQSRRIIYWTTRNWYRGRQYVNAQLNLYCGKGQVNNRLTVDTAGSSRYLPHLVPNNERKMIVLFFPTSQRVKSQAKLSLKWIRTISNSLRDFLIIPLQS